MKRGADLDSDGLRTEVLMKHTASPDVSNGCQRLNRPFPPWTKPAPAPPPVGSGIGPSRMHRIGVCSSDWRFDETNAESAAS